MNRRSPKSERSIFLWHYCENRRNYPGYHLTANLEGCKQLLDVLERHEITTQVLTTDLSLSAVTPKILSVPANTRGNASCVGLATWELMTRPDFSPEHFAFQESHAVCRLELSRQQAGCIANGVRDIQIGKGDYCIGGKGNNVLWFWWFVGT